MNGHTRCANCGRSKTAHDVAVSLGELCVFTPPTRKPRRRAKWRALIGSSEVWAFISDEGITLRPIGTRGGADRFIGWPDVWSGATASPVDRQGQRQLTLSHSRRIAR